MPPREAGQVVGAFLKKLWKNALFFVGIVGCAPLNHTESSRLNEQGVDYLAANNLPKAHDKFVEAWKQEPQNAETLYNLATTYQRHGQNKVAEQYYRQALQLKPDFSLCRHNYYVLLVEENRILEARQDAQNWVKQSPNSADALTQVGWLTRLEGNLPEAQKPLQQALAMDPHNSQAMLEMGKVYQEYNLNDRAKTLYARVLSQEPENKEARALLTALKGTTPQK